MSVVPRLHYTGTKSRPELVLLSGMKTYIYTFIVTPNLGFSVTMSNYNI